MNNITFEIKNKEYQLPSFLSIDNYVKIFKVKDLLGERYFQAKLISTITGAKMEDVLQTNHQGISFVSNYLLNLFPDTSYPFIDKFELNGIEYGFIPSWKAMSFAEFVDLDTLMNKQPDEVMSNLHILCAIMYRPIISKKKEHDFKIEDYDSKTMVERAELFRTELDVKYVLGGQFFFSNFVKKYSTLTQQSLTQRSKNFMNKMVLTWRMRKMIWKLLLKKPLDGSQLSTEYVKMTLQGMNKSLKLPLWKRLTNFFTSLKKKSI